MQQEDHVIPVIWNNTGDNEIINTKNMVPIFPKYIYPVQKCGAYGSTPPLIPVLQHISINTSMLCILIGILTPAEKIWVAVTNVLMKQSDWHGCILSYISNKCLTHINNLHASSDPFKGMFIISVEKLMSKMVSKWFLYFLIII